MICLRLIESHLEGPGIDNRQQISFVDVLAFLEIDLRQLSVHAQVNFKEGQNVNEGDLLGIDPRSFQVALDQARIFTATRRS